MGSPDRMGVVGTDIDVVDADAAVGGAGAGALDVEPLPHAVARSVTVQVVASPHRCGRRLFDGNEERCMATTIDLRGDPVHRARPLRSRSATGDQMTTARPSAAAATPETTVTTT